MKEVTRRTFMGGAAAAVAVTSVTPSEASALKKEARESPDAVLVVLETNDNMFDSEELLQVMELVQHTFDASYSPGDKRVGVIQLPPGMKMEIFGGDDGLIRKLRKVTVAQTQWKSPLHDPDCPFALESDDNPK